MTRPAALKQQTAANARAAEREYFAYLMEQGTGKTRTIFDKIAEHYLAGRIDGVLLMSENGVHREIVEQQLVEHWDFAIPVSALWYKSGANKTQQRAYEALLQPAPAVRMLTMNYQAFRGAGYDLAVKFLKSGRMAAVLDESSNIKTPGAEVTRDCWAIGRLAKFRYIMTGTEITQGPLDLYAQFQFMAPGLLGCPNFATFKARYAEWRDRQIELKGRAHIFKELVRYKNLEELKRRVAEHSYQVLRKDCIDLPEQSWEQYPVVLMKEAREVYDKVKARILAEFEFGTLTTQHHLTKVMRLAQIAGGFLPLDDLEDGEVRALPNAKLAALTKLVADVPADQQIIVWCRFRPELFAAQEAMQDFGSVARWWGGLGEERIEEKREFEAGKRRIMVAQTRAGSKGHNWTMGTNVYYYSNSFSYEDRKQSEDRSHRIGTTRDVLYTDLVALDTVDQKTVKALRAKQDVAQYFKSPLEIL